MNSPKEYYTTITSIDIAEVARELLGDRITGESGNEIIIDCPRHVSQSKRSFQVNREKQRWKCFGCDQGGDVLHLVEFVQSGVVTKGASGAMPDSHRAARAWLAKKAGLPPLSQHNLPPEQIAELEKRRAEEELVFSVLTDITGFYHRKLLDNSKVLNALRAQYGIADATVELLEIGYADNAGLITWLKNERKHSARALAKTGCFTFDHQDNMHPFFKNRFIFPYWKQGKVVYLIGRRTQWTEDTDYEKPKYKKLPVRNERRKHISRCINNRYFYNEDSLLSRPDFTVITEGVTDCISLMEHGFPTISPVTAKFREEDHEKLFSLVRRMNRIYICQDNEISHVGENAAVGTANFLTEKGLDVRIVFLPLFDEQKKAREILLEKYGICEGLDPHEMKKIEDALSPGDKKAEDKLKDDAKQDVNKYFQKKTADDFNKLLADAQSPIHFSIESIPADAPAADRNKQLDPILRQISRLPKMEQDHYVEFISGRFTNPKIGKTTLKETLREIKKATSVGGDEGPTLLEIAQDVIRFAGPFCYASNTGWFQYRDGVWNSISADHVNNIILERLDTKYKDNNTTKRTRDEIRERIAVTTGVLLPMENVLNGFRHLLNLTNGMYDIESGKLLSHDPKYYSTIRLPYPYDPSAKCPRWLSFLDEIFPGDETARLVLQEWFGYCLTPDTKYEKALFCLGEGCNGKTKALTVLEHLVGKQNCSHVPLDKLDEDFHTISLFNKLLNLCIETEAREIARSAAFKSIVSGETQEDAYKYRDRFSFPVFARLCFATNHLPRFSDTSLGLYRRILALNFDECFEGRKDSDLEGKLLAELPGVFQWALEGYRRLHENGEFTTPMSMQDTMRDIQRHSSSVLAFVEDECEISVDEDSYITNAMLYQAYKDYCRDNGKKPLSSEGFFKEMRRVLPNSCEFKRTRMNGRRMRYCTNITFSETGG